MKKILEWCRRNPLRAWIVADTLVTAVVVQGLVVFGLWNPDASQLAYLTGLVTVVANAFGFTVVHNQVTPEENALTREAQAFRQGAGLAAVRQDPVSGGNGT